MPPYPPPYCPSSLLLLHCYHLRFFRFKAIPGVTAKFVAKFTGADILPAQVGGLPIAVSCILLTILLISHHWMYFLPAM